jgi:hypothetical protein
VSSAKLPACVTTQLRPTGRQEVHHMVGLPDSIKPAHNQRRQSPCQWAANETRQRNQSRCPSRHQQEWL